MDANILSYIIGILFNNRSVKIFDATPDAFVV